jgi:hypothetical protein
MNACSAPKADELTALLSADDQPASLPTPPSACADQAWKLKSSR